MKTARPYKMQARAASAEATKERIVVAAYEQFIARWYDEVTLREIAQAAGVSTQTLVNHFGTKADLLTAVGESFSGEIEARRAVAEHDVAAAISALVDDYEITGDAVIRFLALEDRVPGVAPMLASGRAHHRAWVERTLGGGHLVPALVVATDVYTWKLLRRDQGLSRDETVLNMRRLVDGVLAHENTREDADR